MEKFEFKRAISIIAAILFASLVIMLLWNWLIVGIFGLVKINFLQALGLFVFTKFLIHKMDIS